MGDYLKMRKGGGKQKGASFEREVCVMLSKWLTNGSQEDVFWRSAMSGGRATVAFKRGKRLSSQVGDISSIHPTGERFISVFATECKFYADLNYEGLLTGKGKLLVFWHEINKQAKRHNKLPFLVAKQNRMPAIVCLSQEGVKKLRLHEIRFVLISRRYDMYLIEAAKFVKVCTPHVAPSWRPPSNRSRKRLLPIRSL